VSAAQIIAGPDLAPQRQPHIAERMPSARRCRSFGSPSLTRYPPEYWHMRFALPLEAHNGRTACHCSPESKIRVCVNNLLARSAPELADPIYPKFPLEAVTRHLIVDNPAAAGRPCHNTLNPAMGGAILHGLHRHRVHAFVATTRPWIVAVVRKELFPNCV
jgi:hypothetical protein